MAKVEFLNSEFPVFGIFRSFFTSLTFLTVSYVLVAFPNFLAAQEFILFETENGIPDKIFGWDMFEGFYPQPHPNSIGNAGGVLTVEPAGGLISSTANLYAFMTMPAYNFTFSGLNSDQPFTSIVIQIATTEIINETRFTESPSEFIELGVRSVLSFEGDDINVNYYWVEWEGLPASSSYEFTMAGMEQHVVFTGARVACFNTQLPLDIEFEMEILLGDVNCDGEVSLLDVGPFVELITIGGFSEKADINQDGFVDLLDVGPFVGLLAG